jgi:IclR family acetate operon transcriptional repressor
VPRTDAHVDQARRAGAAARLRRRQGDAGGDGTAGRRGGARPRALPRHTAKTITAHAALARELAASRERGYALDDEEHADGLFCVACALWDENGEPWAAISLAGPTSRITPARVPGLGALVRATAADLTAALGGHPPRPAPR